jgi:aryl-alcohol dehydrogenase-like predicted oxidoreductase
MRLCLGTAQFGLRYGIANKTGQVEFAEVGDILRIARSSGIDMLDTAIAYGSSEQTLGAIGIRDWKVITKLPPFDRLSFSAADAGAWVRTHFQASLERLQLPRLQGLLLHRPADLLEEHGPAIYAALRALKDAGLLDRIGISIYDPAEIAPLLSRFEIDLLQAPFNVIDRRLESSGWLARLHARGIEVHTRSAFLQGLLLMPSSERPIRFERWIALWNLWSEWLKTAQVDPVAACLRFVLARPQIARVVLGVDNAAHLRQLISASDASVPTVPPDLASEDLDLIEPSRWGRT